MSEVLQVRRVERNGDKRVKNVWRYLTRKQCADQLRWIADDVEKGKADEWVYADVSVYTRTIDEVRTAGRQHAARELKRKQKEGEPMSGYHCEITWADGTSEKVHLSSVEEGSVISFEPC